MKKIAVGVVVLALIAGGAWAYLQATKRQYTFAVRVFGFSPEDQITILNDGVDVAKIAGDLEGEFTARGPEGRGFSRAVMPRITARRIFPCGLQDMPLEFQVPNEQSVRMALEEKRNIPLAGYVKQQDDLRVDLWIDNRKGPQSEVAVGEYKRPVPAGAAAHLIVPIDTSCAAGRKVRFNGVDMGELPNDVPTPADIERMYKQSATPPSSVFLLDPSATRCYAFRYVNYSRSGSADPSPAPTRFVKKPLHRLPARVNSFLEEAPTHIWANEPLPSRSVVSDARCN